MNDIYTDPQGREWEYLCLLASSEVGEYNRFPVLRKYYMHDPRSPSCLVITKEVDGTNLMDAQGNLYRKKIV